MACYKDQTLPWIPSYCMCLYHTPQCHVASTLTLVYQFPSLSVSSHIDYQVDTNICPDLHAKNRFKMEPMYPRGPLTGRRGGLIRCNIRSVKIHEGGVQLTQLEPETSTKTWWSLWRRRELNSLGPPAVNTWECLHNCKWICLSCMFVHIQICA